MNAKNLESPAPGSAASAVSADTKSPSANDLSDAGAAQSSILDSAGVPFVATDEKGAETESKARGDIGELAVEVGEIAAELKVHQDNLLNIARDLDPTALAEPSAAASDKVSHNASAEEKIAQLTEAIDGLRNEAANFAKRNVELTLLSKMNDLLQTSTTEGEAYSIISKTAAQLFPDDSGAVFVLSESRDMLEAATVWGPLPPAETIFPSKDCWALQRGQVHLALGHERRCPHVTEDQHMYVCVPLLAQGETLGVLYVLDGLITGEKVDEARIKEKAKLAKNLADEIGLGIANLKSRESMRALAIRDPLTGLFNRRYVEEALAREQHQIKRSGGKLAVIMIDIDHFKRFNDDFGHDGGDAVLRALGTFLKTHVRAGDIACRYGGEEFVLILSPSTAEGAQRHAEKIREAAALLRVSHADRALGAISLSVGVAVFPDHAPDAEGVIKAADVALYQAKHAGRNRVVMFTEENPAHLV